MGKCPSCKEEVTNIRAESVNVSRTGIFHSSPPETVMYLCPSCNAILSIESFKS